MGTPEFAVPILDALLKNTEVLLVVTQPDKTVGRKKVLTYSPVKECALKHNIPVFQPSKIRFDYEEIKKVSPDLIVQGEAYASRNGIPYEVTTSRKVKAGNKNII